MTYMIILWGKTVGMNYELRSFHEISAVKTDTYLHQSNRIILNDLFSSIPSKPSAQSTCFKTSSIYASKLPYTIYKDKNGDLACIDNKQGLLFLGFFKIYLA